MSLSHAQGRSARERVREDEMYVYVRGTALKLKTNVRRGELSPRE